jgi:hypothetical protein
MKIKICQHDLGMFKHLSKLAEGEAAKLLGLLKAHEGKLSLAAEDLCKSIADKM